jgi:hypothetical protein
MLKWHILCGMVLMAVVLAACSPGGAQPAQPAQQPAAPSTDSGNVIVVTNTPTPAPKVPDTIAIMPGATDVNVTDSDVSYVIKSSLDNAISFYQKEMAAKGWKEQEKPSIIGDFGRMYFSTSNQQVSMLLNASPSLNQVVIRMTIVKLSSVMEGTATPKP